MEQENKRRRLNDSTVDLGKMAAVKAGLALLMTELDEVVKTGFDLKTAVERVNGLDDILNEAQKPRVHFSSVTAGVLKKLNVNRGCLQFSPSVLAGLTENMAETTKVLIESLRTQILDIYEYVSIDYEPGSRTILDAVLLCMAKSHSLVNSTTRVVIFPEMKLGAIDGVSVVNTLTNYEVCFTGSVDYGVILYDDTLENRARMVGPGGSRDNALKIAKGCLLLVEDMREDDIRFTSYIPGAVARAIALHKSTKKLDEARFCLSNGMTWVFYVLTERDGQYTYYESHPMDLSSEVLKRSDASLREIVQLMFEWLKPKPTDQLYELEDDI